MNTKGHSLYVHICPGVMMHLNTASTDWMDVVPTPTSNNYNYYFRSMPDGSHQQSQHYNKASSALLLLFLKSKRRIGCK